MWEKRTYLFLLKHFQYSRKRYLTGEEYAEVWDKGVDNIVFMRFAALHWNIQSIILIRLGLLHAPKNVDGKDLKKKGFTYDGKFVDTFQHMQEIKNVCAKEKFIKLQTTGDETRIRILYKGRIFIRPGNFYTAFFQEYDKLWFALLGFIGGAVSILTYINHTS